MDKDIREKIGQLQALEQNLQHILAQKQSIQSQLIDIDSALEALKESNKNQTFKIVGAVMIESPKENLLKDLNSKKEIIEVKIKSTEKQEKKIKENLKSIQEDVLKNIKNE